MSPTSYRTAPPRVTDNQRSVAPGDAGASIRPDYRAGQPDRPDEPDRTRNLPNLTDPWAEPDVQTRDAHVVPNCIFPPSRPGSVSVAAAQSRRAITVDDLLALHRVSDPQISPDSSRVVYTVATPDRPANRVASNLWVVPIVGGAPRQLTFTGRDGNARWSPDGSRLAFLSSREGSQQIYLLNLTGGEPTKLTSLDGGANQIVWAPDGKSLAFTSSVWPDCADDACNKRKSEGKEKDPVKARAYDGLLYRHWTAWRTGQRAHLFVVSAGGGTPNGPDAGRQLRRAAGAARGPAPHRLFAGWGRGRVCRGHRRDGGHQHQRRHLHGEGRRQRGARAVDHQPGLRRRASLLARRQVDRVSRAEPARQRGRPVAADEVRPTGEDARRGRAGLRSKREPARVDAG